MAGTLRRLPLFAGLSDEQFESVLVGEEVWLEPGEYLVREETLLQVSSSSSKARPSGREGRARKRSTR